MSSLKVKYVDVILTPGCKTAALEYLSAVLDPHSLTQCLRYFLFFIHLS